MSNVLFRMIDGDKKVHFETTEATPEMQLELVKGLFGTFGVDVMREVIIESPFSVGEANAPFTAPQARVLFEDPMDLKAKQRAELAAAKSEVAATVAIVTEEVKAEPRFGISIAEQLEAKGKRPAWMEAETQIMKPGDANYPRFEMDPSEETVEGDLNQYYYVTEDRVQAETNQEGEVPMFVKTGFKVRTADGAKLYKCRYLCSKCQGKSSHYIPEGTKSVNCHTCQNSMRVRPAVTGFTLSPDAFKNWFLAGDQKEVKVTTQEHYKKLTARARH